MHHNYKLLNQFDLYDYIDHTFTLDSTLSTESRYGVWPSDSSVILTNSEGEKKVVGACHRAIWYRMNKVPETNPLGMYEHYVFELGKIIEKMHIDKTKISGLYKASNVKFWLEELKVSGEIDLVIRTPDNSDKIVLCELKTSFGYAAKKDVIGNSKNEGFPKYEAIMQLCTYLYAFRNNPNVIGGKILYFLRDDTAHRQYNVHLVEENGIYFIHVDGVRMTEFNFNDVMNRIKIFHSHYESKQLPPQDYSLIYSDDEMELAYKMGDITEKAYETFKAKPIKSNRAGDWRCVKCRWKNKCYSTDPHIESPVTNSPVLLVPTPTVNESPTSEPTQS